MRMQAVPLPEHRGSKHGGGGASFSANLRSFSYEKNIDARFISLPRNLLLRFCVAVIGLAATAAQVNAQIVVSDMNDQVVSNSRAYFKFNTATGAVYADNGNGYAFYVAADSMMFTTGMLGTFNDTWFQPSNGLLSEGSSVTGATFTNQIRFGAFSPNTSVDHGYVGLRFDSTGGDTSDAYFGWLRFSYRDGVGLTLHEFAMQALPNVEITAGQVLAVPEPSTYAAIAGVAVLGWATLARRRKTAAADCGK